MTVQVGQRPAVGGQMDSGVFAANGIQLDLNIAVIAPADKHILLAQIYGTVRFNINQNRIRHIVVSA